MQFPGVLSVCAALAALPATAATVSFTDTIETAERDFFNGFEALPASISLPPLHSEGGITVAEAQFGGTINSTETTWGAEGARSWATNFGLSHYTTITRTDGGEFGAVGLLLGTLRVLSPVTYLYRLFLNGVEVQSGSILPSGSATYVGFCGGGFDRIDLRDTNLGGPFAPAGGWVTTHVIDSIEATTPAPVPVPAGGLLAASGLGLLAAARRRRRRTRAVAQMPS